MREQDKRAVEGMAQCGISLEGLLGAFPKFPTEEIETIYKAVHNENKKNNEFSIKINCS